jgi:hypothetical protein
MKPHCNGPCNQGRNPCPTPEACEMHHADNQLEALGLFAVVVAAIVLLVTVGLLIA